MDSDSDTDESTSLTFRQLQYNHNQLMEEKKRMEEYFDEVDHDAQQKNREIGSLRDKLDQMKKDLRQANSKASEVEAGAAITEEALEEERARARRVLPKVPSKGRFSRGPRGLPEVQSIDTHAMSREKLVQEIRTLESELEYTHEKNLKQEEELDILKGVMEELQERRQQDEAGGANTGIELPARSGKLEDVLLADPGGTVVTVVDGQLHSIIVDCRDILDSAAQVAVLYDELESREAQFEDVEKENAQLCDLVDEVNQELQVAKDEVVKLEEAAVAAVARANSDVLARDGPSALTESLGDIIEAAAEADDPNSAVAVAALRADFKAAQTQINEQKEEIARLEATLLANREVMGMTIEEQMVLISDQIGLKIRIDELSDETAENQGEVQRLTWETKSMQAYMKNRDQIVYGLLEKPVKAKDRKKLLKILKETAMGADGAVPDPNKLPVPESPNSIRKAKPQTPAKSPTPSSLSTASESASGSGSGSGSNATQLSSTTPAPAPAPAPDRDGDGDGAAPLPFNADAAAAAGDPAAAASMPSTPELTPDSKPRRTSGFRSFFNKGKDTPSKTPAKTAPTTPLPSQDPAPATPRAAPVARAFPQELLTPGTKAVVPQIPASGLSRGAALLAKKTAAKDKAAKEKVEKLKVKEKEKAKKDKADRTMNLVASGEISAEELAMLKMMEDMNKQVANSSR